MAAMLTSNSVLLLGSPFTATCSDAIAFTAEVKRGAARRMGRLLHAEQEYTPQRGKNMLPGLGLGLGADMGSVS